MFTTRYLVERVGAPTEEEVDAQADQVTVGREATQDHGEVTDPLKLHLPVYGMGHSPPTHPVTAHQLFLQVL